jgi:hypothetical protein
MPNFNEQLKTVAALREHRRECDETLYRARIELHQTRRQIRMAGQQQTVVNTDRDSDVTSLRAEITRLDAKLAEKREKYLEAGQRLSFLDEQGRLVEHLKVNLRLARDRQSTLLGQISEQEREPDSPEALHLIENELARLKQQIADLEESSAKLSDDLVKTEGEKQAIQEQQQALRSEMDNIRDTMRGQQGKMAELLRPSFTDVAQIHKRQSELERDSNHLGAELIDCDSKLNSAIAGLYLTDPHPKDALRHLDDRTPFLLFPVRLETIFVQSNEKLPHNELWVRVYPDDIAIHTHEKVLTDREVLAGELYWTELVTAEHLRKESESRRRSAWLHLVELFGGQRAAWLARQTKPTDWEVLAANGPVRSLLAFLRAADGNFFDDLFSSVNSDVTRNTLKKLINDDDGDAFSRLAESEKWFDRINAAVRTQIAGFPAHAATKTDGWTRAPRTYVMPDRFVLLLYANKSNAPREIPGNLIPDTLFLGPDPLDAEAGFKQSGDDSITFAGSFDWMSEFDKAVKKGMGFRVRLTNEEASKGFERIVVLGVSLSNDAMNSGKLLEELFDNHQFSPKGFSLVPQGSPTNNTSSNGTGYSDNETYNDLAFISQADPPAFDPADPDPKKSQTDGRKLADALGIAYANLQTVQHADQTDALDAEVMNTALFPGTLGYWLHTWMAPLVTDKLARQIRAYFTKFVSGRGLLPAVRVGNQPYGILLTSDFSRWKYPKDDGISLHHVFFNDETGFLKELHSFLLKLQAIWDDNTAALSFIGKPNSDPSEMLIKILGLHPTSVEFFQRIGYSDEYLRDLDNFKNNGAYANELASLTKSMPATARLYLRNQGFNREIKDVGAIKALHVLWQHYVTALDVPNLIENLPPSETKPLTLNYIDWLAKVESTEKIIKQDFQPSPPTALLYLMLRNALLLQLHHGAYEWLENRTEFDDKLAKAIKPTTLVGMRKLEPNISKFQIMQTRVEAAEPGHPSPATSVADWIWRGPNPVELEAGFLREQKSALSILANVSTARLERCFVEHLDCCNYRLDAWQTGLFAQRLKAQRVLGRENDERQLGIYLGAYGWVENLKPLPKKLLTAEDLPYSLRSKDSHPIIEESDVLPAGANRRRGASTQGGFVHAPSLNHASAAALLRNAYLSHAKPEQAEMFSVNLSSERVRRAEFILEGMRNGQPIEALLGYQFERGLHDRTSRSAASGVSPVLELNEFILSYRQAFPLESREIAQNGTGGAIETVPAYNVVNGLRLTQTSLSPANGYGLNGIKPPVKLPDKDQGAAILAEQTQLLDTLDAVKDLLMAENAYQLAQGNFDRVAAVSLAQKDAHIPPELQVINTPRGSEFTFTNRVTLHFDDRDPSLPTHNPWPGSLMTPRANAEAGMNYWLGELLGLDPENVLCSVHWVEKSPDGKGETSKEPHFVALSDLGIQPIDFVWMVSISPEDTGGATELELRIAYRYRKVHHIGDDKTVRIEFNPPVSTGKKKFAQLFPLARQLRALLTSSRALHAGDFLPASGGKATAIPIDKNNPEAYEEAELRSRLQSALNDLTALFDSVAGASAETIGIDFVKDPENAADDVHFTGLLGQAFDEMESARLTFTDVKQISVQFSLMKADALHNKLERIANYGITDAFPPESDLTSETAKAELLARAHRLARRLRRKDTQDGILDRADEAFNKAIAAKAVKDRVIGYLNTGKILFGDTFDCLPKFTCFNEIDLSAAAAARSQLLKHAVNETPGITGEEIVEEWLQGLARVRPSLHRWEVVRTLADALTEYSLDLRPVQVPFRMEDSWLAVEFPKTQRDPDDPTKTKPFGISRDTLSIAAHGSSAFVSGVRQSGILLDDWVEEIPTSQEITGISYHFNQPNAAAPQALLLVVTPEETGSWKWDDLVGTLSDTLNRAKRRAVEPEQLEKQGSVWNALWPGLVSEFSAWPDADVSLDMMLMLNFVPLTNYYFNLAAKN